MSDIEGKRDIRSLTGLRGLAALWVVTFHVASLNYPEGGGPQNLFLRHGYMAVDVFFVLSGFVMALSYQAYFRTGFSFRRYAVFLTRRIARVYPLYVIATAAVIVAANLGDGYSINLKPVSYLCNFLMVQNWGITYSIDRPAWSVSAELFAYIMFPLLTFFVLYRSIWLSSLTISASFSLLIYASMQSIQDQHYRSGPMDIVGPHSFLPVFRCLAEFTIGLAVYRLATHIRGGKKKILGILGNLAPVTFLIALGIQGSDLVIAAIIPVVILCLALNHGIFSWLLATRPLFFLGEISYAVYLIHIMFYPIHPMVSALVTNIFGSVTADAIGIIAMYSSIIIVATAAYRWLEIPARVRLRKLERLFASDAETSVQKSDAAAQLEVQTSSHHSLP